MIRAKLWERNVWVVIHPNEIKLIYRGKWSLSIDSRDFDIAQYWIFPGDPTYLLDESSNLWITQSQIRLVFWIECNDGTERVCVAELVERPPNAVVSAAPADSEHDLLAGMRGGDGVLHQVSAPPKDEHEVGVVPSLVRAAIPEVAEFKFCTVGYDWGRRSFFISPSTPSEEDREQ